MGPSSEKRSELFENTLLHFTFGSTLFSLASPEDERLLVSGPDVFAGRDDRGKPAPDALVVAHLLVQDLVFGYWAEY